MDKPEVEEMLFKSPFLSVKLVCIT